MKIPTEKQIQMRRLALGLAGLPCNDAAAETVLLVESEIEKLGNKFSLRDAANIEYHIHRKYHAPKISTEVKKKKHGRTNG